MPHWRKMFDERFVGSWDFDGKESFTATISGVKVEEMADQNGTKLHKPVVYFEKAKKGLVLNKTNAKTIAELYGNKTEQWKGKAIVLFATTCEAFGKQVECVRVRNQVPRTQGGGAE